MTSGAPSAEPATRAAVIPLLPVWRIDRAFDYRVPDDLAERVRVGSLVRMPFGNRVIRGVVVATSTGEVRGDLEAIAKVVFEIPLAAPPLDRLFEWLARRYAVARGVAFARVVPPRLRVAGPEVSPLGDVSGERAARLGRYERGRALLDAIRAGDSGVWSVRALPSDDRGALIAEIVAAAAPAGQALVVVPEVRFGAPVLDRVAREWPLLARLDSAQPERARAQAWLALAQGHGLGGGGRSAVLAPAPGLRVIVVDEEHDPTFKEDRSPRYDARRVAIERARLQGAVAVLVSSTPSLEATHAAERGGHEVRPPRAERRAARPVVEVVDPEPGRALTKELHERVRDVLRRGDRVALLVPSKGYARALWCASCKRSLRCPVCEAGLFYDRQSGRGPRVRCVRCGFTRSAPDACPTCGAAEWRYVGAGSERLVEQVAKSFPRADVARMDPFVLERDDARDSPAPDVYVTTWIGTKPVLRPDVSLVGVLDGDSLLRKPDFRAAESAYHAFAAMAEWAGPASTGGRLVIQCSEPGHHSVQAVVRADHDYFVERELELRRDLAYPPFAELVKVGAFGPRAGATIAEAAELVRGRGGRVLGPVDVSTSRGSGREILVKCPDAQVIAEGLRDMLARAAPGTLTVDVDPR